MPDSAELQMRNLSAMDVSANIELPCLAYMKQLSYALPAPANLTVVLACVQPAVERDRHDEQFPLPGEATAEGRQG